MTEPLARSPLQPLAIEPVAADAGTLGVGEVPLLGAIVLRGQTVDDGFSAGVRSVLGVLPPATPCTLFEGPNGVLVWLSPDEWMLLCARRQVAAHVAALRDALASVHAQVTDVSGGYTLLRITGERQAVLLRHLGAYPFESLAPGRAVGTGLVAANVFVLRLDAQALYVIVRRSFAEYLWLLLMKAGRPYGIRAVRAPDDGCDALSRLMETPR